MKLILINLGLLCLILSAVNCFSDSRNPNLEYELINAGPQRGPEPNIQRPTFVPITRKPLIINTPPPVDPNSKTFAFDAQTKTWTMVKRNDPPPSDGTLLWNQDNDKWLTQTPTQLSR